MKERYPRPFGSLDNALVDVTALSEYAYFIDTTSKLLDRLVNRSCYRMRTGSCRCPLQSDRVEAKGICSSEKVFKLLSAVRWNRLAVRDAVCRDVKVKLFVAEDTDCSRLRRFDVLWMRRHTQVPFHFDWLSKLDHLQPFVCAPSAFHFVQLFLLHQRWVS